MAHRPVTEARPQQELAAQQVGPELQLRVISHRRPARVAGLQGAPDGFGQVLARVLELTVLAGDDAEGRRGAEAANAQVVVDGAADALRLLHLLAQPAQIAPQTGQVLGVGDLAEHVLGGAQPQQLLCRARVVEDDDAVLLLGEQVA